MAGPGEPFPEAEMAVAPAYSEDRTHVQRQHMQGIKAKEGEKMYHNWSPRGKRHNFGTHEQVVAIIIMKKTLRNKFCLISVASLKLG